MKCECGCGQEVKPGRRFVRGHNCVGKQHSLGYTHSDETKIKIGAASKGRKPNQGREFTPIPREKIGLSTRRNKHWNWQGGKSFEPYCAKFNNIFKEKIREQFGRVCFLCGKPESDNNRKLDVHHVNYNKECLCAEIECEFVPLCRSCHVKIHNGDKEYWENMILKRLEGLS